MCKVCDSGSGESIAFALVMPARSIINFGKWLLSQEEAVHRPLGLDDEEVRASTDIRNGEKTR